jgi:putative tryptophan/tyrosine transport system substrate-binding protein
MGTFTARVLAVVALLATVPAAHAQGRSALPLVAILDAGPASAASPGIARFKQALHDLGWVEGRTVRIESRYGDWRPDRMAAMANELVALKPDVLYTHSDAGTRAAIRATSSIPIVVGAIADLLATGAVNSLAQPGGNVTGVTHAQHELDRKRLEVLKDAVPSVARIAYLFETVAIPEGALQALEASARLLGVRLQRVGVLDPAQIETAFDAYVKRHADGVLVQDSVFLSRYAERITRLALTQRLPTVSQIPGFAERGGLLQYGADVVELFRRSATHVDKILKGAKPADLPVEQPTKVDLIVNLRTATALGITIPQALLIRADRIIE